MSHEALAQFANQKYLNLESFKRDGTPAQTLLWFAEDDGILYIYTLANAWKVKRIRRNPRVRIVPCTMRAIVALDLAHVTPRGSKQRHIQLTLEIPP